MKLKNLFTAGTIIIILALGLVAQAQDYVYIDPDKTFSIRFPAEPETGKEVVPTELGDLDMFTIMYEASYDKVYMLAYTDYPADLVNASDAAVLLNGAKEGSLGSFGISTPSYEKSITFEGHPGTYFEANGNDMYVAYKLILVENRLYQIVILQMSNPISDSEVEGFIDTFKLL